MSFVELASPPSDAISSIRFSSSGTDIAVGSWDSSVRVYTRQADNTYQLSRKIDTDAPVLDVCWGQDESTFFAVGIEEDVVCYRGEDKIVLSSHDKASNQVAYSHTQKILLSTSWDATLHIHDPESRKYVRLQLPAKPFALSLTTERAVVAMAERKVFVYELRALKAILEQTGDTTTPQQPISAQPWQQRDSSLKFMTRDVACMPDGTGFAISSIEGRCGVEWFDEDAQEKNFAFKCHREKTTVQDENGEATEVDIIYPVNALAFHPVLGSFVTGGGDGVAAIWDPQTKRRIKQYEKRVASIAAMDTSADGKYLAIAISPGFEDGKEAEEPDPAQIQVLVRALDENEAKPKPVKAKK